MEGTRSEVKQEERVINKDLMKVWWKWVLFQEAGVNYKRLQTPGFFYVASPALVELYGDSSEELVAACKRRMQSYNFESYCGLTIHGIALTLGEERASGAPINDEAVSPLGTGLMGPLAGLGDFDHGGAIAPIATTSCISIGQTGNLITPLLLEGILVAIAWPLTIWLLKRPYHTGKEDIQEIFSSSKPNWITTMTSTLGGIILRVLAASYIALSSPLEFVLGKGSGIALQADVLDMILRNILPSSMILLSVYLLDKKISAVKIILTPTAICVPGILIGIF